MLSSPGQWIFLLAMVTMTTVATLIVIVPLLLRKDAGGPRPSARRLLVPVLAAAAIATLAGAVYLLTGTPDLATAPPGSPHPGAGTGSPPGNAGSIEDAAQRLAARLRDNPDDTEGWRLLAQSYQMLGRLDEARAAWAHVQGSAPADLTATPIASALPDARDIDALAVNARARPHDVDAWLTLAQAQRLAQRFTEANSAYEHAIGAGDIPADAWADYADSQAAANGSRLVGRPEEAIRRALTIEPGHVKALWLKGSAEVERRDYRAALQTWQQLARQLPADSPDARAIAGNITEARAALAGTTGAAGVSGAGAHIRGTVELDGLVRKRVAADDTLFVVARPAAGGPPYAVLRTRTDRFPFDFDLDDTLAMVPGHDVSSAQTVIVEARISRSGNALPQSGDLRAATAPLRVADQPQVHLRIREVVP